MENHNSISQEHLVPFRVTDESPKIVLTVNGNLVMTMGELELLRIEPYSFSVRGVKLPQDENEARAVFDATRAFFTVPSEELARVRDSRRYRFLRDNPDFQIEYTAHLTLDEHVDLGIKERNYLG